MRHGFTPVAVVVILLGIAACAELPAASGPEPLVSPLAAPSVEPSTDPVFVDEAAKPAQVLDANCSRLLSDADVAAVMGESIHLFTAPFGPPITWAYTEAAGGLDCTWSDPTGERFLSVTVIDEALAGNAPKDGSECSDYGPSRCDFGVHGGDLYSFGLVSLGDGKNKHDARAASTRAAKLLAMNTAAAAAFVPSTPTASTWSVVDCTAITTAVDPRDVWDLPRLTTITDPDSGLDPELEPYVNGTYAENAVGHGGCSWQDRSDEANVAIRIRTLSPGAWIADDIADYTGAEPVSVAGADSAYIVPGDNGGVSLHVFTGANWMIIQNGDLVDYSDTVLDFAALVVESQNESNS